MLIFNFAAVMRHYSHLHFNFLSEICNGQSEFLCALIAVSKSHEFHFFDDDDAFTSTRRNFFHDDARDSTSTTSRCFFQDVGHYKACI